ncbi:MAG TPA: molybdenum cofactor biosynthesis protein MoaE [Geobacteraceae bacterium]
MTLMLSHDPIDPATVYDLIAKQNAGSVVFHYAVVKEQKGHDGVTTGIEYQSAGDTEAELREIAAELKEKWKVEDLLLIRRVGRLGIGDIISLIAASSPNSEDAFAACRHGIARMKKMATIRKQEMYG